MLMALERISFDGDPLQVLLVETTYQPIISFLHMTEIAKHYPELKGLPDYASALAIEIRAGPAPDQRDFVRVKFKNGTHTDNFETLSVFGHRGDIPLTEFIYRLEVRLRVFISTCFVVLIISSLSERCRQLSSRMGQGLWCQQLPR
jgi:lysosomal acid phosphatase